MGTQSPWMKMSPPRWPLTSGHFLFFLVASVMTFETMHGMIQVLRSSSMVAQLVEHRYIEKNPEICGGEPLIRGTRITVRLIVGFMKMGQSVDEVIAMYPHLSHAQVHDALSCYYDHREEIEAWLRVNTVSYQLEKTASESWRERSYILTKT
jgi:uncharacterized protein (DUF433 family)